MGKEVLIKGLNFSKTVATRRAASRLMVTMGGHSRMGGKTHAEGGSGGGIFARNREDPAPTVGMAGRSLRGKAPTDIYAMRGCHCVRIANQSESLCRLA